MSMTPPPWLLLAVNFLGSIYYTLFPLLSRKKNYVMPSPPPAQEKPSDPPGDLKLVTKDRCKFVVLLDFAETRARINIPCFSECWRLEKLYCKDFSIHAINSVDAALSSQSAHVAGFILESKWRFSNIEVSIVSEYTTLLNN